MPCQEKGRASVFLISLRGDFSRTAPLLKEESDNGPVPLFGSCQENGPA